MINRLLTWFGVRALKLAGKHPRDPALRDLFGARETLAGVDVDETTAHGFSAVWAADRIISGAMGMVPAIVYRRGPGDTRERATDTAAHRVIHDAPNPELSPFIAKQTGQSHLNLWGNAYAEIERNQAGEPLALWPITPDRVRPDRDKTGKLYYIVRNGANKHVPIPADRMLHVPGLGFDGIRGYSVVSLARQSIGLALGAEAHGAAFYGNKATPSGVLVHPAALEQEAIDKLRTSWEALYKGVENSGRIAVLDEGVEYKPLSMQHGDAQFLETRQFQITEVARWFNLPPHMLRDLMRATFSNIEVQSLEFVIYTLGPWLVSWEQEYRRKLLTPSQIADGYYVEHLVDALLRGDTESRYRAYATGRQWGWLSADEIRQRENMNPLPDGAGQTYLSPANMMDAGANQQLQQIRSILNGNSDRNPSPVQSS